VVVSVDPDSKTAKDRSRSFVGLYLALFPNIAQETQLPNALIQQVRAAFHHGGPEAAAAYIDDEVVDYLTASGTPVECHRKIETYRAAGVQMPILFPLDPNVQMAIETLGPLL
jgi:5,10-methylenetetrahydromethanopterin reductase